MITTVGRNGKRFTVEELREIAAILARMEHQLELLRNKMNGRVLVHWLDPMIGNCKAHRWYNSLREALDADWIWATGSSAGTPFYGEVWHRIVDAQGSPK
jgi:hypothetical protein